MVLFRNCILGVIILSISLSSLTYGKENHVIHIDEFIVNIISEEINHYAKVSLAIEMSNEPAMTAANRKIDKVRDTEIPFSYSLAIRCMMRLLIITAKNNSKQKLAKD